MIRKVVQSKNFPHRLFAVVAVFTFIAFLLTLKPVATEVRNLGEKLGISMPSVSFFRNAAANMMLVGIGVIVLLISPLIVVAAIKVAVVVTALALVGVGLYNLYNVFFKKSSQEILPTNIPTETLPGKG
jgi:hypothetical protein